MLLARILAPADFGVFAVIVLLTSVLVPFGDLGLGATLIQRREPPTERDLATAFTAQQVMWLILLAIGWRPRRSSALPVRTCLSTPSGWSVWRLSRCT